MDSSIARKIKKFVHENRTSDALDVLLEASLPNKQVHGAIHIVLGEFNDLTSSRLRGEIDNMETAKRIDTIHDKILFALNSFDGEGKPLPDSIVFGSGQSPKFLLKLGLLLGGAALLFVLFGMVLKLMSNHAASNFVFAGFLLGLCGLFVLLLSLIVTLIKGR